MSGTLLYRAMLPGEEASVCALVLEAFHAYISQDFTAEGIRTFREYIDPEDLAKRARVDHFVLVAMEGGTMAGVIEVRENVHVSLLFVAPPFHRRGIARALLHHALDVMLEANPALEQVTVNASRYALRAYERLGFRQAEPEQVVNGIIFTPMVLDVKQSNYV